jgi:hypothetical protein
MEEMAATIAAIPPMREAMVEMAATRTRLEGRGLRQCMSAAKPLPQAPVETGMLAAAMAGMAATVSRTAPAALGAGPRRTVDTGTELPGRSLVLPANPASRVSKRRACWSPSTRRSPVTG